MDALVVMLESGRESSAFPHQISTANAPMRSMAGCPLADELLSAFKERDSPVRREAIESALRDPTLATAEWFSKHARAETLLSREELTLYNKLDNSGALQSILRDPELGSIRPFLDDDIRATMESLEASTANIQRRTETLSRQCEMLKRQSQRQDRMDHDRTRDVARLRKKHEVGRQNTVVAANDLSSDLEAGFQLETDKTAAESKRILSLVSSRLKQDDKTLANLETRISGIKSHGNNTGSIRAAVHLSTMLADFSAEEIHYRLDRIYLEALQTGEPSGDHTPGDNDTVFALKEELASLCPEIDVLAEMSAQQQFHEPILREIHSRHKQLRVSSQLILERALDEMVDMTLSTQAMMKQLEGRESVCELLEQLASLYQSETASPLVTRPSSRRESFRRRSLQPGVLSAAHRNPASMPEQPAVENLLRRIGVSPESVFRPRAEDRPDGADGMHEKRLDFSEALHNLQHGVESPLATHLSSMDYTSQLLASSLHANTHFQTSLRDHAQEETLSALENELASLQKGVQGLDLDVLHQRDKTRDRFLDRWH